ncbi:Pheophytinase, chloroplastic [Porphyridium purpureum]|uniref:Pheophytinase, chloroplastic n=1 Tax=Porphyridium purpureum TaxID=35688 RepID=A0A5J4YW91_PORPP|nr:Pheophytinase, chloroplastic [Porphyridium purpureum]|eukprot:POR9177..scf209_3
MWPWWRWRMGFVVSGHAFRTESGVDGQTRRLCDVNAASARAARRRGTRTLQCGTATVTMSLETSLLTNEETTVSLHRDPRQWRKEWTWRGHKVRYAALGESNTGPCVLLVHGFGASADHWRFNAPVLADRGYRVFAIDLLGFGLSAKPSIPEGFSTHGAFVWMQQLSDFIEQVMPEEQVYLAGNSLGGYSVLNVAAYYPERVKGLALVNAAGPIVAPEDVQDVSWDPKDADPFEKDPFSKETVWELFTDIFARGASLAGFLAFRRKERIRKVLEQVYPSDKSRVDDDIVEFIYEAAMTPNAFEVFYRTAIGGRAMRTGVNVNNLISRIRECKIPVVLLWGVLDPWITSERAEKMLLMLERDDCFIPIQAGHCPHDENPAEFNEKLDRWLQHCEGAN